MGLSAFSYKKFNVPKTLGFAWSGVEFLDLVKT